MFKKSLEQISHHSTSQEKETYPILSKSIFSSSYKPFISSMRSDGDLDEMDESIYGSYVLPGSIYLFHPAIADGKKYIEYEEEKNKYVKVYIMEYITISQSSP